MDRTQATRCVVYHSSFQQCQLYEHNNNIEGGHELVLAAFMLFPGITFNVLEFRR